MWKRRKNVCLYLCCDAASSSSIATTATHLLLFLLLLLLLLCWGQKQNWLCSCFSLQGRSPLISSYKNMLQYVCADVCALCMYKCVRAINSTKNKKKNKKKNNEEKVASLINTHNKIKFLLCFENTWNSCLNISLPIPLEPLPLPRSASLPTAQVRNF